MALTDLLKSFVRGVTLGAALYSCGGEEKEGCSTDYDCREPRVCVRGYCEGGNGGVGENNSLSTLCRAMCTCSDNSYSCAEDFHLPRNSQCFDACEDFFRPCSMEAIRGVYDCQQSYCYDCDEQPSQWFPCLDSVKGLKPCVGDD